MKIQAHAARAVRRDQNDRDMMTQIGGRTLPLKDTIGERE